MSVTTWEPWDGIEEALSALRVHDADPGRVERTRTRCLAALAARQGKRRTGYRRAAGWLNWLEPAVALGLGALYLADAVVRVLASYR